MLCVPELTPAPLLGESAPARVAKQLLVVFFELGIYCLLPISSSGSVTQVTMQLPLNPAPEQLGHISDTWCNTRRYGDKGATPPPLPPLPLPLPLAVEPNRDELWTRHRAPCKGLRFGKPHGGEPIQRKGSQPSPDCFARF